MSELHSSVKNFIGEKVTCVCVTGDRSELIKLAIHCFLNQDYENRELLIIDDGSCRIEIPDHPLILYIHVPKMGLGEKRNFGCANATGKIIMQWDDDDWFAPTRISHQVGELKESVNGGLLDEGVSCALVSYHSSDYYVIPSRQAFRLNLDKNGCHAFGGSFCYLKALWEKHPFALENPVGQHEDAAFIEYAFKKRLTASLEGVGQYVVRRHGSNTSSWFGSDKAASFFMDIPLTSLPQDFLRDIKYTRD